MALSALMGAMILTQHVDEAPLLSLQDSISEALVRLETISLEARHERMARLTAEPDQGSLVRTMSRLRHDLVMIWRAALVPLPEEAVAHACRYSYRRLLPHVCPRTARTAWPTTDERGDSGAGWLRRGDGRAAPRGPRARLARPFGGCTLCGRSLRTGLARRSIVSQPFVARQMCRLELSGTADIGAAPRTGLILSPKALVLSGRGRSPRFRYPVDELFVYSAHTFGLPTVL